MNNRLKKAPLLAGDLAFLILALISTVYLRYSSAIYASELQQHWRPFAVVFAIWLFSLYINNLYDLNQRALSRRFFRSLANAAILSSLLSIIYFYLNVASDIAPRTNLLIFVAIYSALFIFWRYVYQAISRTVPRTGLAILGGGAKADNLTKEIERNTGAGYQLELVVNEVGGLANLQALAKNGKVKVVVASEDFGPEAASLLLDLLQHGVSVYAYPDFYELISGKIPVEEISASWFLENLKENQRGYFNFFKRALDLSAALILLIITLPFWPLIALIIKLESAGPVFFRQERLGRRGRHFQIIKFRTMKEAGNDRSLTADGDKRITKAGGFFRKTRIDEIPQILNIIKGEMSFIGPRPERPELAQELERAIPFYNTRLIVKPGVSGWDQVSGEYHSPTQEDTLKKLQNDLYYIKNRSLFLDAAIALKTVATMLGRGGR